MDKNQATGLVLMAILLLVYFIFFGNQQVEQPLGSQSDSTASAPVAEQPFTNQATTQNQIESTAVQETPDATDSVTSQYGIFSKAMQGKATDVVIENDLLLLKYSTKGGLIREAALKQYDDYQYKMPMTLLDENSSQLKYMISTSSGNINLADLHYVPQKTSVGDTTLLSFKADLGSGKSVEHIYKLAPDSYQISHQFIIND
jgi:YidC/Oxa1 family membrane protein insertase